MRNRKAGSEVVEAAGTAADIARHFGHAEAGTG